jgi:hypothetical protein
MSITFDSSVNSMIGQAQAQSNASVQTAAQIKLAHDVYATQESAIMTLIGSTGLQTYSRGGAIQTIAARGRHVEAIG